MFATTPITIVTPLRPAAFVVLDLETGDAPAKAVAEAIAAWKAPSNWKPETAAAKSKEAAEKIIEMTRCAPTVLVNSGHGLQAWWLFERPWIITDKAERGRALAEGALRYASTAVTVGASRDEASHALEAAFARLAHGKEGEKK